MGLALRNSIFLWMSLILGFHPAWAMEVQWLEETGGEAYNLSGVWTAPRPGLAAGEARLIFDYSDDRNYYYVQLRREQAVFIRVREGVAEEIGVRGSLLRLDPPEQLTFTLQRRPWQKVFVCNNVRTAWTEDATLPPGRLGYGWTSAGMQITDLMLQPVGEMEFTDDFMRTETGGDWEALRGRWSNNAQGLNVERSANAFSFKAEAQDSALAVTGYPFWNDYLYEAAVRCDVSGAVGLVFNFQDEQNYHLFRWSSGQHPDGGRLQLLRVFQGETTKLGEREGGFEPHVWYKLRAVASGGLILTWIDDAPVFHVAEPFLGQGMIGLYAENTLEAPTAEKRGALFDDVVLRPWPLLVDDFSRPVPGRWRVSAGGWEVDSERGRLTVTDPRPGLILTGTREWKDYTFAADVTAVRGTPGLVCYAQDANNYLLFRWTGPGPEGRAQWVQVREGRETVLEEADGGFPTSNSRLQVTAEDGYFAVTVDGQWLLDAMVPGAQGGGLGFYAADAVGTVFDNVFVYFSPVSQPPEPVVPAVFKNDPYMRDWANPRGEWVPSPEDGETQWHKGFFFGDHRVAWTWSRKLKKGPVTVALGCQEGDLNSGYALTIEPGAKPSTLRLTLHHREVPLATAEVRIPPEAEAVEMAYERRGRFLRVTVEGEKVLLHRLP